MKPGDEGYPRPTSRAVSAAMRGNRKVGTAPEARLGSFLHRWGYRYRKQVLLRLPGLCVRPDLLFPRERVAIFVDGCFWHGCPEHGTLPRVNTHYWHPKLARTHARDLRVTGQLSAAGWLVLRFWEHEPVEQMARVVSEWVESRRASLREPWD